MNEIAAGSKVLVYGRTGSVVRLAMRHRQAGADILFTGKPFTEWYPLDSLALTVIEKDTGEFL